MLGGGWRREGPFPAEADRGAICAHGARGDVPEGKGYRGAEVRFLDRGRGAVIYCGANGCIGAFWGADAMLLFGGEVCP